MWLRTQITKSLTTVSPCTGISRETFLPSRTLDESPWTCPSTETSWNQWTGVIHSSNIVCPVCLSFRCPWCWYPTSKVETDLPTPLLWQCPLRCLMSVSLSGPVVIDIDEGLEDPVSSLSPPILYGPRERGGQVTRGRLRKTDGFGYSSVSRTHYVRNATRQP